MIPTLNDLRIVELSCLILHEAQDPARLGRIREEIGEEGVQRNPVIVAPYDNRYLVLDGAHRVLALRELGLCFALVQLVELPERAGSWGHLLDAASVEAAMCWVGAVEVSETLPERGCLAVARFDDGEELFIEASEKGLVPAVRALWALRAAYPEAGVVHRVDPGRSVELAAGEAALFYRSFTPGELAEIVSAGEVLPAGITRFVVEERVLNVRYPLTLLGGGEIAARNEELRNLVKESWEGNRTRYYREPVVLFE